MHTSRHMKVFYFSFNVLASNGFYVAFNVVVMCVSFLIYHNCVQVKAYVQSYESLYFSFNVLASNSFYIVLNVAVM